MNIQIFGSKKDFDTKKAERYFKERGIKAQFIDMKEKGMSKGEFNSVCQAVGGYEKYMAPAVFRQACVITFVDLAPWESPAVFGKDDFGDGAQDTLNEILKYCGDTDKTYYLGGYSLAGLFALWAAYQTDVFSGIVAASPSMLPCIRKELPTQRACRASGRSCRWFPGFDDYMDEHELKSDHIYLSLGDKDEKTRNPVMQTVGDKIRAAHVGLEAKNVDCILEWNQGNHFKEPDLRMAKGFAWLMD